MELELSGSIRKADMDVNGRFILLFKMSDPEMQGPSGQ